MSKSYCVVVWQITNGILAEFPSLEFFLSIHFTSLSPPLSFLSLSFIFFSSSVSSFSGLLQLLSLVYLAAILLYIVENRLNTKSMLSLIVGFRITLCGFLNVTFLTGYNSVSLLLVLYHPVYEFEILVVLGWTTCLLSSSYFDQFVWKETPLRTRTEIDS